MNKISSVILTLLVLFQLSSKAQDTVVISKSTLLGMLEDQNVQLKIAEKAYESARADYRQSNALFLPNITASHTAITTTNPLMAFGSKLNQEILTQNDFNPALLNDPSRINNFATVLEAQMPLINVDGYYQRSAAKSTMESFGLQTERTKEYLELELSKSYMQLQLAYRAVDVLKQANETAAQNLKLVKNYFANGMLQKTDVLDVEVRVNELKNQLQYAKSNVRNASDYIAFLTDMDGTNVVLKPSDNFQSNVETLHIAASLPIERKDIKAMDMATQAYLKMYQSNKLNFLPRLNAFGNYQLYDNKLFGTSADGYLIGVQLSWNLFAGYKNIGKMQKARADYHKAEAESYQYKQKSQLELNKTKRQLIDAKNKMDLSQMALDQAKESYRIRKNRFEQGLEKTSDLLMAETVLSKKELEYLQAIFEYNFTQKYLEFLTK